VLAGFDKDDHARIVSLPGSSFLEFLRPKPSSQPAAASMPEAVASLVGRSVVEMWGHAERSLTGVSALWLGDYRF
jgi:protease IV